jgi:hypothetical protein
MKLTITKAFILSLLLTGIGFNSYAQTETTLPPIETPGLDSIGSGISTMSSTLSSDIQSGNATLESILGALQSGSSEEGDITRSELATALINYEALSKIKDFQLNMDLLYELAPGAMLAAVTAERIGSFQQDQMANLMIQAIHMRGAYNLTNGRVDLRAQFTSQVEAALEAFGNNEIDQEALQASLSENILNTAEASLGVYERAKAYVLEGDLSAIRGLDPGSLLSQTSDLQPADAVGLIGLITDPMPIMDPELGDALARMSQDLLAGRAITSDNDLTPKQKETFVAKILEMPLTSMSNYALSDMAARRAGSESLMKNMAKHSSERFGDPAWHNEIAKASEAALLRELVQMMSFQQWTNYQNFRVQEQQMALLATMTSVLARLTAVMDMLRGEYNAALQAAEGQLGDLQLDIQGQQMQEQNLDAIEAWLD